MEAYLTSIPEAARALGIGRSKVYELLDVNGGPLGSVTIGRRRLVRTDSIRALALGAAA